MKYHVHLCDEHFEVEVDDGSVSVDGVRLAVDLGAAGAGLRGVIVGDEPIRVLADRAGGGRWALSMDGAAIDAEVLDSGQQAVRDARRAAAVEAGPIPLRAPMPGLVIRIEVEPGDLVEPGDGLLIVEAMKMENELKATAPGQIEAVLVVEGDTVERNQVLVEFAREHP